MIDTLAIRRLAQVSVLLALLPMLACKHRVSQSAVLVTNGDGIADDFLVPVLVKLNISWISTSGSTENSVCTGSLITPSVVITASHCAENYDLFPNEVAEPTTSTRLQIGADPSNLFSINYYYASGNADFGLYLLQTPAQLPDGITPLQLPAACSQSYTDFRLVGRMRNKKDGPVNEYQVSATDSSSSVGPSSNGSKGQYITASSVIMDGGDSGGPWFLSNRTIIAVNHASDGSSGSSEGTELCGVVPEITDVVQSWGAQLLPLISPP